MVLEIVVFLIVGAIEVVKDIGIVAIVLDFGFDVVGVTVVDLIVVGLVVAVKVVAESNDTLSSLNKASRKILKASISGAEISFRLLSK